MGQAKGNVWRPRQAPPPGESWRRPAPCWGAGGRTDGVAWQRFLLVGLFQQFEGFLVPWQGLCVTQTTSGAGDNRRRCTLAWLGDLGWLAEG